MSKSSNYRVEKIFSAGSNSSYSIFNKDGTDKSPLGFDSASDAQAHIERRESLGQDPLSLSVDYDKMAEALLNS